MDSKIIEKARQELREDETRKKQSLEQIRERLAKHPFLSNCRQGKMCINYFITKNSHGIKIFTDDSFLLRFLRVKKYNVDDAFLHLERSHLSLSRFPQYYDDIQKSMELFELGNCYPLIDRDEEGRRIVLIQTGKSDPERFSVTDAIRLYIHVGMILQEEEETQICGLIFVLDNENISIKHVINPVEARDLMTIVKSCAPMRQKGIYMTNLPSYANIMVDLIRPFFSEKLKHRVQVLKDNEELKTKIDVKLLPRHLGGTYTEEEMKENFRKIREKYLSFYEKTMNVKIDLEKVDWEKFWPNKGSEIVGSFRKLDID